MHQANQMEQRAILLFIVTSLQELSLSVDVVARVFDKGVARGSLKPHLLFLFAPLCECISNNDGEIREIVKTLMKACGEDINMRINSAH